MATNGIGSIATGGTSSLADDSALESFLQDAFDPADYLNATLPALSIGGISKDQSGRAALAELSSKTQILLSQLNAQTSRLSANLSQLTDEMIRSGSRLAYEVEILRGETTALTDTLAVKLKDDITLFSPPANSSNGNTDTTTESGEPEHIKELRMLTHVRTRLDTVIKTFGSAMQWPVPPSEMSTSLISVTAPNVTAEETRNREEKGREAAQRLTEEVSSLLSGRETPEAGIAAATARVEELRALAGVWKGTTEEKYRVKFVEGLGKMVEDERARVGRRAEGRKVGVPTINVERQGQAKRDGSEGSYGFMNSLRKIRGEIYME